MEGYLLRISGHWIRNWSGGRKKPTKNVQNTRKIYWYKERMERCYGLNQKQLLTECYIKIKYHFTMKKNWFWMESFYIQIS